MAGGVQWIQVHVPEREVCYQAVPLPALSLLCLLHDRLGDRRPGGGRNCTPAPAASRSPHPDVMRHADVIVGGLPGRCGLPGGLREEGGADARLTDVRGGWLAGSTGWEMAGGRV